MPIYRVPCFGVLVTALGEHHARHGGIPTHDYEEKDGYEGGADLPEAAADTRRMEIFMAYIIQARFRTS